MQHLYIHPCNKNCPYVSDICYFYHVYLQTFLHKYSWFSHFYMIPVWLLITLFLFFLKLFIFIACSFKDSQNSFHAIFTSVYIMLIFYFFRWWYRRHSKIWLNILTYFDCIWFFKIIWHPWIFSIKDLRSE